MRNITALAAAAGLTLASAAMLSFAIDEYIEPSMEPGDRSLLLDDGGDGPASDSQDDQGGEESLSQDEEADPGAGTTVPDGTSGLDGEGSGQREVDAIELGEDSP